MSRKKTLPSFTDPSADVLLVSCDNVSFPVMKGIMMMASSIFRDMFSLPQGDTTITQGLSPKTDDRPSISLAEDSHTLNTLLCIIYPVEQPNLDTNSDEGAKLARDVLGAALKYDIPIVVNVISQRLLQAAMSPSKPNVHEPYSALRLYAIACRHSLRGLAESAAQVCLQGDISALDPCIPEFDNISANEYLRLIKYQRCVVAAVLSVLQRGIPNSILETCYCGRCGERRETYMYPPSPGLSQWWKGWVSDAEGVVAVAPLSTSIYSATFMAPALQIAQKCTACVDTAPGRLTTITKAIREQVDIATESIKLEWKGP